MENFSVIDSATDLVNAFKNQSADSTEHTIPEEKQRMAGFPVRRDCDVLGPACAFQFHVGPCHDGGGESPSLGCFTVSL